MSETKCDTIHRFEEAGLGLAPFRFLGVETDEDREDVNREAANAGLFYTTNFATSCDYCGNAIHNAYRVESADGKRFKVGCECIRKVGDKGLIRVVKDEEARKRREKADAKRKAQTQRRRDLLAAFREGRCESLRNQPHPKGRDESAYDYVAFCISCGAVGEMVLRMIENAAD